MDQLLQFLDTVGFQWPKLLAQVIIFVVLYIILNKFAFGPVIAMLEARRQRIEESEKNYEKIKKQLAEAEARHKEILAQAAENAQKIIDEARASSADFAEIKKQEAVAEAERIVAKAQEATRLEHAKMLADLRTEIGRLVVETTGKVVGRIITPEDQKRLSEDVSRRMSN